MKPEPKYLFLDTENTPKIAATWRIHETRVAYTDVIQEYFLLSSQWAWGDGKTHTVSILDDQKRFKKNNQDDYHVIKTTCDLIQEADIIVGHNIKNHDLRNIRARQAKHRIPPFKMPIIIDTLEWARKFGFTSKKLGDLCKFLDLSNQKQTHDPGAFIKASFGDIDAIQNIVKYGRGDIPTVRELFYRMRPYMEQDSKGNHNIWRGDGVDCCPKCGSTKFEKRGFYFTAVGKYQRFQCLASDCQAWFKDGKMIKHVSMR